MNKVKGSLSMIDYFRGYQPLPLENGKRSLKPDKADKIAESFLGIIG